MSKVGRTCLVCFGNVFSELLFSVYCVCYCVLTLRATILWTVFLGNLIRIISCNSLTFYRLNHYRPKIKNIVEVQP